jgi:biotin synthase
MAAIIEMVKGVRSMGLETCMTLGMLSPAQADMLADAGWIITTTTLIPAPENTRKSPAPAR